MLFGSIFSKGGFLKVKIFCLAPPSEKVELYSFIQNKYKKNCIQNKTMSSANILTAFNDHFAEFVTDIQNVFPEDVDILTAKNSLLAIRKANPKMIVKIWNTLIVGKYRNEIEKGDISFFIHKDYSQDVADSKHPDKIMDAIDRLREPIKQMSPESQAKTMKYIQNLTKLALIYDTSK